MTPHLNRLNETVQMRGLSLSFYVELTIIIPNYHQILPLYRAVVPLSRLETIVMKIEKNKNTSGPGCSKLTMPLVNETLKFQMLISQICQYLLLKKCEKLLQCKSFSHFFNKKSVYLNKKS